MKKWIKEILKRMKSPVFWTEMVLVIAMFLRLIGVYDMPNAELTAIQDFITGIFTVFATLNNPTTKNSF